MSIGVIAMNVSNPMTAVRLEKRQLFFRDVKTQRERNLFKRFPAVSSEVKRFEKLFLTELRLEPFSFGSNRGNADDSFQHSSQRNVHTSFHLFVESGRKQETSSFQMNAIHFDFI